MPIYEYSCEDCGTFAAMAPMAAFAQGQPCPVCGRAAPRNLVTAPALGGGAATPTAAVGPRHAASCGCCAPRRPLQAEAVAARK